jgi:predicted nucleic acid-binding protein
MQLIVSDTTTLIVLEELSSLALLGSLFEKVLLPKAVFCELKAGSAEIKDKLEQAGCFEVVEVVHSDRLDSLKLVLDKGEAEAITLAVERKLPILIDERKGRVVARQQNLEITGFAGVLIGAVKKGVLTSEEAQVLLDQSINNGFRLSSKLYKQVSLILKP